MPKDKSLPCKRPYTLGRRREQSDQKRAAILSAARRQLERDGLRFTMDSLAAESGVTRQTVHNLFGTKTAVLEALFDEIALQGGMEHMPSVMQASDPEAMLGGFVKIFADFWASAPKLLRRVHGVAAIDPEFGRVVEARNRRRQLAATRVVDLCGRDDSRAGSSTKAQRVATLYALTSFEFFDALSGTSTDASIATEIILTLARNALGRDSLL